MNAIAQVFAVLAGLIHVFIFGMESVLFRRPKVHQRFLTRTADVDAVRLWAFNQGWYNLFLAVGAIGGVVSVDAGNQVVGRTLVLFSCACMLAAAGVLLLADRRMARGALIQGTAPLIALIAALA
ncbi:DUF1304 domain-containing protein [Micromonospora sp. DT201]|uniref:DUF1304 domain-containing protein n=1 Tax=Micromonospora sp. DT201 TaxID=3393442 RepID=UPI003CF2C8E8